MRAMAVLFIALMLSACATASGDFCDHARPFSLTDDEIAALERSTVNQMNAHHSRGELFCGWRP